MTRLRRVRRDQRGVALLMVLAAMMTLTILVTDISFGARVRTLTAIHTRQQTQAYYLANSGISIYRLVLTANVEIGKQLSTLQQTFGDLPVSQDMLWKMLPFINTGLLRMLLVADGGSIDEDEADVYNQTGEVSEEVAQESREEGGGHFSRNFLDFEGDFNVTVRGEDCRVNVNALSSRDISQPLMDNVAAKQIAALMSGEDHDQWLRERNLDKWQLIGNLADWVDTDDVVASGKGSYEDDYYNRLDSPYLAKNARFDTPEELRLVEGWQDEVYARFAEQLTIYGGGKIDINCADDTVLKSICLGSVTGCNDDMAARFVTDLRLAMTVQSFTKATDVVSWMGANGYDVSNPKLSAQLTTKNTYFTLISTGQVGDASARITAALDYSTSAGKILFWKVD